MRRDVIRTVVRILALADGSDTLELRHSL